MTAAIQLPVWEKAQRKMQRRREAHSRSAELRLSAIQGTGTGLFFGEISFRLHLLTGFGVGLRRIW